MVGVELLVTEDLGTGGGSTLVSLRCSAQIFS